MILFLAWPAMFGLLFAIDWWVTSPGCLLQCFFGHHDWSEEIYSHKDGLGHQVCLVDGCRASYDFEWEEDSEPL